MVPNRVVNAKGMTTAWVQFPSVKACDKDFFTINVMLTYFVPLVFFYNPWKYQKTSCKTYNLPAGYQEKLLFLIQSQKQKSTEC